MASYGTIPTSSSPVDLEYISRAKDRFKADLATRRPWRQMFDLRCFAFPKSVHEAAERIRANYASFRMNYAIIALIILFLSLLWFPISLIVFVAMMAVWLFLYFLRDEPLVVFGRMIGDQVVLIVLSLVTIGVLLLTRATLNILVALLIGVVVVLMHAAVRKIDDLVADEEAGGGLLRSGGAPPSSSS